MFGKRKNEVTDQMLDNLILFMDEDAASITGQGIALRRQS